MELDFFLGTLRRHDPVSAPIATIDLLADPEQLSRFDLVPLHG
jgi:hypothetical protein